MFLTDTSDQVFTFIWGGRGNLYKFDFWNAEIFENEAIHGQKKLFLFFFFCKLYGLSNYQTSGQTIHLKREQKSHKKKWVYCWQWVEQKFPFLSKAAANTSWSLHGRFPPSAGSKSYNELFLQNDQWPRTLRKKSNTTSTCTLIWN